jgi:hypothetical protein
MTTMVPPPPPAAEKMPKHDEGMGGISKTNIGGELGLVRIYSTQRPIETRDNSLQNSPFWACRIKENKIEKL